MKKSLSKEEEYSEEEKAKIAAYVKERKRLRNQISAIRSRIYQKNIVYDLMG